MRTNVILTSLVLGFALLQPTSLIAAELRYATYIPATSSNNTKGVLPLFEAVKANTGGRLSFSFYPGGQLLDARAMLSGIKDGIADAGFLVVPYYPSELKHAAVIPGMVTFGSNPVATAGAVLETYLLDCPKCNADFTDNGVIFLAGHATTPYNILCSKPVASVNDLKGLKMRTAGGGLAREVEALGGVPVSMTSGEVYEGLQRGQIDCVIAPKAWLRQYSLAEVVKFIYDVPLGSIGGLGLMTMNINKWKGLDDADRTMILKELPGMVARVVLDGYVADDKMGIDAAEKAGIEIVAAPQELHDKLAIFRQTELAEVERSATERGVENAREITGAYLDNLKKWNSLAEDIGTNSDKYREVLWREIYSKL